MQNGRFASKIALCLKKVLSVKTQRQSCKAFIGLSIRVKMICGVPFYVKIWRILTHPFAKR